MSSSKAANSKHPHDALSIRVKNSRNNQDGPWEFKARLPVLEVSGYTFYLAWIFLLYFGEPLAPLTIFSDKEAHSLRIVMIAVVALMYLVVGIFAKPFASKKGYLLLVAATLIFAPLNCFSLLIPDDGASNASAFWALTGIGHASILLLWSKHLVLFTRRQLILITSISCSAAGLIFILVSYLQPVPAVVTCALLPIISLAFYLLGSKDADQKIAELKELPHDTSKKPLIQLYIFAVAYCIALGFMGACVTMGDYLLQSIIPIGAANILAGGAMLFVLTRYKRDIARTVASIFLPGMALCIFVFAFAPLTGRLICIALLFFIFGCNDVVNITTVAKTSPLYGVNYIRTFGFGRLPNGLGVLLGWLLAYVIFFFGNNTELGLIFVSFLLVVIFVFAKTFVFDAEQKSGKDEHAAFAPPLAVAVAQSSRVGVASAELDGVKAQVSDATSISADILIAEYCLSSRQAEVLHLLAKGRNAEYIQEKLFISNHTAKSHIYSIYRKLGVHSQQELLDMVESHL